MNLHRLTFFPGLYLVCLLVAAGFPACGGPAVEAQPVSQQVEGVGRWLPVTPPRGSTFAGCAAFLARDRDGVAVVCWMEEVPHGR